MVRGYLASLTKLLRGNVNEPIEWIVHATRRLFLSVRYAIRQMFAHYFSPFYATHLRDRNISRANGIAVKMTARLTGRFVGYYFWSNRGSLSFAVGATSARKLVSRKHARLLYTFRMQIHRRQEIFSNLNLPAIQETFRTNLHGPANSQLRSLKEGYEMANEILA